MSTNWQPPDDWMRITTLDAHTAGEPLRIITGGLPPIPGDTILAKRRYAQEHLDGLRTALMWEPRGHADMYGCIPTAPTTPDGTLGVLFLHNEGWSTMCGHGIIGLVKVGIETGLLDVAPSPNPSQGAGDRTPSPNSSQGTGDRTPSPNPSQGAGDRTPSPNPSQGAGDRTPSPNPSQGAGDRTPSPNPSHGEGDRTPSPNPSHGEGDRTPSPSGRGLGRGATAPVIRLDTPAGRVTAYPHFDEAGRVTHVSFDNVPSFVYALDQTVDVPGLGRVRYDLAFGGAFYAYVAAEEVDVGLTPADFRQLIDLGTRIKHAVMGVGIPQHPFEPDLSLLYGVIFVGQSLNPPIAQSPSSEEIGRLGDWEIPRSREVCVFADGEVDRSPTGTGVSGRAALHYAKGEIGLNQPFVVESILGTTFIGEVVETTTFGPYPAVVPRVSGTAFVVGRNELVVDPNDPLRNGFLLR